MKKYAITLLILILIGVVLSVSLFTQEQRLDQNVFLQTTKSIRNLQSLDKNLSLLLVQSRFNSAFENSELLDRHYELSEEFDNLRFEALFEEIESSEQIDAAVNVFDERFLQRYELLENYVDNNEALNKDFQAIKQLGNQLVAASANNSNAVVERNQQRLLELVLNKNLAEQDTPQTDVLTSLSDNDGRFSNSLNADAANELLQEYNDTVVRFNNALVINTEHFQALQSLATGPLLDAIEDEYTQYHNRGIRDAQLYRNILLGYGVLLLAALLFFGWRIRHNYLTLEQEVADRTDEISSAYKALQESQEQLIQSEKMASLGQMVAGVAHEINTPLGYVTSNVDILQANLSDISTVFDKLNNLDTTVRDKQRDKKAVTEKLVQLLQTHNKVETQELMLESQQLLNDGAYGLSEISKLVVGLKDFARLDRQAEEQVDINDCVTNSLTIASNHIKENNVLLVTDFDPLPTLKCNPSKINQLFLNVITNACQSMHPNGGQLLVQTVYVDNAIRVSFTDEGTGMSKETQQKMFDPFFTTKEIGQGTGLGMSIAYKIIQAHNGTIEVESSIGEGSKITVVLPKSDSKV